jgi:hypothetical protein
MIEIKTEVDGFVKTSTGALLNKDNDALIAYKAQKKRNALISTLEKKYQELEQKVLYLENELYKINKRFDDK